MPLLTRSLRLARAMPCKVVCTEATRRAIAQAQDAGRSTWRVSSTVFSHIASDQLLQPLGHFAALPLAKVCHRFSQHPSHWECPYGNGTAEGFCILNFLTW